MTTISEILNKWRTFNQGDKVINCVRHMHVNISARPRDCELCNTDMRNFIDGAIRVNNFLNDLLVEIEKAEPEPEVMRFRELATFVTHETGRALEASKAPALRRGIVSFWDGYLVAFQQFGEWLGIPAYEPVLQKQYALPNVPASSKWTAAAALIDLGYNLTGCAVEFAYAESHFHNFANIEARRVELNNLLYVFKMVKIGNVYYLACDDQGLWLDVKPKPKDGPQ